MRFADRLLAKDFHAPCKPRSIDPILGMSMEVAQKRLLDEFGINIGPGQDSPSTFAVQGLLNSREEELLAALARWRDEERQSRDDWSKLNEKLRNLVADDLLPMATIVRADNVYRYCRDNCRPYFLEDLPCLAPKWPRMFVEWTQDNGQSVGVLAICDDRVPFRPDDAIDDDDENHSPGDMRLTKNGYWFSDNLPDLQAWSAVRWVWKVDVFFHLTGYGAFGPEFSWSLALDQHGRIADAMWQSHDSKVSACDDGVHLIWVFEQTLAFLNCRNVGTIWYDPPEKLQKKHRRKRGAQHRLVRYHVITINPAGDSGAKSRRTDNEGEMAFHIVGAGFHHYGDCCPGVHSPKGKLFGKHEGIYFFPQHVRGNPKHGVVVADYEIGEVKA